MIEDSPTLKGAEEFANSLTDIHVKHRGRVKVQQWTQLQLVAYDHPRLSPAQQWEELLRRWQRVSAV